MLTSLPKDLYALDMSRTVRNVKYAKIHRKPCYKRLLLAGVPLKVITTDWDDKPVAAIKEVWNFWESYKPRY